jgi:hypothetical protein
VCTLIDNNSLSQTDTDKGLKWKSTSFDGKLSHDDHARLRKIHSVVSKASDALKQSNAPLRALPAPHEDSTESISLRKYLVGAIESVFSSKSVDVHEPKWHSIPFEGHISHKRDRDLNRLV